MKSKSKQWLPWEQWDHRPRDKRKVALIYEIELLKTKILKLLDLTHSSTNPKLYKKLRKATSKLVKLNKLLRRLQHQQLHDHIKNNTLSATNAKPQR